ncbi:MAG: ATP-dependent DNA helicase [Defluviicoccus sp.]|nr:ATP-dependent DNA helicase [Defluviicoccus sp.]MDE0385893.1 ATP-dependent DNA helicase [Defluviicoccus sp.]
MASADLFGDSADHPVLVANIRESLILDSAGEARTLTHRDAVGALGAGMVPILCHRKSVAQRLGARPFRACDLLELFAFVHPAVRCLPTPGGLADALGLPRPRGLREEALTLARAAEALLEELDEAGDRDGAAIASFMTASGWPWGPAVLDRLGGADDSPADSRALRVWNRLPEIAEHAPPPPPGSAAVEPAEARRRLAGLLGPGAEDRSGQADYTSALTGAFAPRDREDCPNAVIAEAGTGVGKTLGYIAPASLWAEKNGGPVWISTFTRNLQRQIDGELDRLHPDPDVKHRRVVVRKGRDNYLCLLNLEEALGRIGGAGSDGAAALGLVARWTAATRDGDMAGGDFPAWLADLLGRRGTLDLAHRRGECIYSACAHYHKCFIERTARRARRAEIVIANHALVMTLAAAGGTGERLAPTRVIFDEGHHVFDAADGAFAARLSGQEGADLRRWLRGAEDRRQERARGLARRIEDAAMLDDALGEALQATLEAARVLPATGWNARLARDAPSGAAEAFLAAVRRQVYARARDTGIPYDLETETGPPVPGLIEAADLLAAALDQLIAPARSVSQRLDALLDERAEELDTPTRNRLDAAARGLGIRIEGQLEAWRAMLRALHDRPPETFVDWFSVSRLQGRDVDVAMHRHWLDPLLPFAQLVAAPSHGVVVTSATLRDATGDVEADWGVAEMRTGARHLAAPAIRVDVPSPFDYARLARVFVVTDVGRGDIDRVAAAYRALMQASGGGALGLFTAIARLRAVHDRIAADMEKAGLALLAQHVDGLDTTSLVDIFRAETDSCMLGTDAMRDGVDVPGRSLRLIVFDRLPWPRPTILHRERRKAFPDIRYDDMLARLRLKQAFGRLVRQADDRGVFVLLDPRMPSRLTGAFPDEVAVERVGLAEAVDATRAFLAPPAG